MGIPSNPLQKKGQGPLPLVIGVAGHRDLRDEDPPILETLLRRIFADLKKQYPRLPLILLSPLAEGADRLAARIALACGVRLIVPLPLPRALYVKDFTAPGSQTEFAELQMRADLCLELPLADNNSLEAIAQSGPARNRQYAEVGDSLVRHSHILIALWDGVESNKVGGTSHVLQFMGGEVISSSAPTVYSIVTPRRNNPQPQGEVLTVRKLQPPEYTVSTARESSTQDHIYRRMNTFNLDALRAATRLAAQREKSKQHLLSAEEAKFLPASFHFLVERFAEADALALHFQGRWLAALRGLLGLAFLGALCFYVYQNWTEALWVLALVYLGLLTATFGLYLWARRADYENKYLDYRALAEGLRVQLYWQLAGLEERVTDYYLREQRTVLTWIPQAIRAWALPVLAPAAGPAVGGRPQTWYGIHLVLTRWLESESAYFARAAGRNQARNRRFTWLVSGFLVLGLLLTVIKVLLPSTHPLIVAMGMAPVIAALLHFYRQRMAYSEHANQYGRMGSLFLNARTRLQELVKDRKLFQLREAILEVGKEALWDNADWVQIHRERPLEVPGT